MHESEKGFLERLAGKIPGLAGYVDRENRRDTDKRLREYLAAELDRFRRGLDGARRDLLSAGRMDLLDEADRLAGKLQRAADQLRFASYGYAGFFDQVKIGQAELDRIYAYDSQLLGDVQELGEASLKLATASDPKAALRALEASADALIVRIEGRKQIFNTPE